MPSKYLKKTKKTKTKKSTYIPGQAFDMKEYWYTTSGTRAEKTKKFKKKFKTGDTYTQKMINLISPKSKYSIYDN